MPTSAMTEEAMTEDTSPDDHDVIYTLRTAHQNQTQHLLLADQKANVLIGIVAVTLTILLTRIDLVSGAITNSHPAFRYGLAVFYGTEMIALLMAILVIVPNTVAKLKSLKPEALPNPLHFGYFSQLPEEDYIQFMMDTVKDNRSARNLITRDIYQMGMVLKRKYRLLKYAYAFTIAGFLALFGSAAMWILNLF